jgi:hypothetical protein
MPYACPRRRALSAAEAGRSTVADVGADVNLDSCKFSRRLRVRGAIKEMVNLIKHTMGDMVDIPVDNKALKQKDVGMGIGY